MEQNSKPPHEKVEKSTQKRTAHPWATAPSSSSSSPAMRSAYDVLCDAFLLRYIASFQCGFPHDIVEWKRANESIPSPWGSARQEPWGLLPNLAVQTNNLRMLERLYRYHKEQPAHYDEITEMSFEHIWRLAMKCGNIAMAEWIDTNDPMLSHRDNESEVSDTIACAITSPSVDMTKWLLERRPRYQQLGRLFHMNAVAATGNIELHQWLVVNVKDITTSPEQMDVAAREGHLNMVRYLHEHGTVGCTTNAMDNAARCGHLDIVKFLHKHRTEGCTTQAMDAAARNGHLEMVRFFHEHRTEGATLEAMSGAVSKRHFEIVKFLQQNRTEGCRAMVLERATENRDLEMVRFLHEHYPEHSMSRPLKTATHLGQLAIVQYIVENTTQGCVFYCLLTAKKFGVDEVEAYLTTIVDPSIQKCSFFKHKQEDTKRVCQKNNWSDGTSSGKYCVRSP